MDPQPPSSPPPSYQPPPTPGPAGGAMFANIDPKVRNLAFALCGLALLVVIGVFTDSWGSASERGMDMGAGLTSLSVSGRGGGGSVSWGDTPISGDVVFFGYLALLGGLAAAGGAIAMGVFALTDKPNKVPLKIFNIVLGVSAFAMVTFLIRVLTHEKMKGLSFSYSGVLAIGGVIGIGIVAKMLAGLRPHQA